MVILLLTILWSTELSSGPSRDGGIGIREGEVEIGKEEVGEKLSVDYTGLDAKRLLSAKIVVLLCMEKSFH